MGSNFPTYGNNTFGIDSFNQYTLNAFNPYSLYHYTVTIVSPLFPEGETTEIEVPEVTFDDFKLWCGGFIDIEDIDNVLNPLATALLKIGKTYVDINLIGDDDNALQFKRIVSYYVGHYLQLHLEILKDESEKLSFTKENQEVKIELELPHGSIQDYRRTNFGQMFWSLYGHLAKWAFQGNNKTSTWGSI